MIAGLGIDLVTISRIERVHSRFEERFARRILSASELQLYNDSEVKARFLAKRFAVKEAAVKALGTGERAGVLLKDFTISHDQLGKPLLSAAGKAWEICQSRQISAMHVSLSDERDQVVAIVILETQ